MSDITPSSSAALPSMSLIVAAGANGCIGLDNALPWRLRDDLRHFKQVTTGKPIIMGRKTWDSLGRPLPGRLNIVLSRTVTHIDGCEVFADLASASERASQWCIENSQHEYFVIGGAQIYAIALPNCDRLYYTRVKASPSGDEFMPVIDWNEWKLLKSEHLNSDENNDWDFDIEQWARR